jgi:osmotically-inducible protein OsmY
MFPAQVTKLNSDKFSRCEEPASKTHPGKRFSPDQETDSAIRESIQHAFWKDDVLRAIEYNEIAVHVKSGIVYLHGHIVSTTSQNRIENAIRAIPGILGIQNNLIRDDKLTHEVATSLASLEHTYGCKFFTGAAHGVVSLNGIVSDANTKLLAEKCVASHPNVRAVINNVHIEGDEFPLPSQPFLQPVTGETIYFLDGILGMVKQVIVNPNNRRVIGMTVWGPFADSRQDPKSPNRVEACSPDCLIVVPMDVVRFMTSVSGFLSINSHEREQYQNFDANSFRTPNVDWTPPYPYCPDQVLFPAEPRAVVYQVLEHLPRPPLVAALQEQVLWEQLLANDSLGG